MAGTDPYGLVGRWELRRRVVDRRAAQHGVMVGELVVRPDGAGVRWEEQGVLRFGGAQRPATRTYLVRQGSDGWEVRFADGRPFHPWRPGEVVVHPCRDDVYTGLVTVDGDLMRTAWDVRGPAKEQRLVTRFYRSAAICSGSSWDS